MAGILVNNSEIKLKKCGPANLFSSVKYCPFIHHLETWARTVERPFNYTSVLHDHILENAW